MSEQQAFDPDALLEVVLRHGVRFVLIGGLAAQAHGSPSLTGDLDICYARDRDNLERLAAALAELTAARRGLPPDAPRMPPMDAQTLRAGGLFTLTTRYGNFDILADPDPGFDYERLLERAITTVVHGAQVHIASLADLIEMKRAAGRPKDRIELEILGALREELDRRD
jgi:hypothetical protein